MRRFFVALTLLVSTAAVGADAPIPQDKAQMEKRYRERLEWNRQTLQVSYDKIGKKDARWDKPAREALDLAARMFSEQVDPVLSMSDVHAPAKKAVDAGCDDPMLLYLYARTSVGTNFPGDAEYIRRMDTASKAMATSHYSPYRRAVALLALMLEKGMNKAMTPEDRRELEAGLDAVLNLLPASVAEDSRNGDWNDQWYSMIRDVLYVHRKLTGDFKQSFDWVDARLVKIPEIKALELTIKGSFFMDWGWEARTKAFAPAVTQEQFRTFDQRLTEARLAFEEAWKLKPGVATVAESMIAIEKSIGHGDRQAMETWFERAMKADGNSREACWSKLDWLDPKWHGTKEEMLAFARQCRDTKNWRTGITLLIGDAHLRVTERLPMNERQRYWASPEVWSDIKTVFDEYLKHRPDDNVARSKYAVYCFYANHLREAHAQFQLLGDHLSQWPTFPFVPLEVMKKMRDEAARRFGAK
jgi:hypothetical protein